MTTLNIQATRATVLLCSLLSVVPTTTVHANWFDMDDLFTAMEEQMQRMRQEMQTMQQSIRKALPNKQRPNASIKQDEQARSVVVTIENLAAESVEANLDEQTGILQINAANLSAKIAVRNESIALEVTTKKEQKQTSHKDSNQSNQQDCGYFAMHNRVYLREYVSSPLDIVQAKIDYNGDRQVITITIPYAEHKSANKKLPVTMIKANQEQSTEK